jgi:hypothetical protein
MQHTGRRVLRTSRPEPVQIVCHVSLPTSYRSRRGHIHLPWVLPLVGCRSKTPTQITWDSLENCPQIHHKHSISGSPKPLGVLRRNFGEMMNTPRRGYALKLPTTPGIGNLGQEHYELGFIRKSMNWRSNLVFERSISSTKRQKTLTHDCNIPDVYCAYD